MAEWLRTNTLRPCLLYRTARVYLGCRSDLSNQGPEASAAKQLHAQHAVEVGRGEVGQRHLPSVAPHAVLTPVTVGYWAKMKREKVSGAPSVCAQV